MVTISDGPQSDAANKEEQAKLEAKKKKNPYLRKLYHICSTKAYTTFFLVL